MFEVSAAAASGMPCLANLPVRDFAHRFLSELEREAPVVVWRYEFMPDRIHVFCAAPDPLAALPRIEGMKESIEHQLLGALDSRSLFRDGGGFRQFSCCSEAVERWQDVHMMPLRTGLTMGLECWAYRGCLHWLRVCSRCKDELFFQYA